MKERQRQVGQRSGSQYCIEPCNENRNHVTDLLNVEVACFLLAVHGCALYGAIKVPDRHSAASDVRNLLRSSLSAANSVPAPFSKAAKLRGGAAAVTPTQLVQSFVAATERGDAAAALKLVTDDFLYKTYRATTDSLAAAEARLQKKFPAPTMVRGLPSSRP